MQQQNQSIFTDNTEAEPEFKELNLTKQEEIDAIKATGSWNNSVTGSKSGSHDAAYGDN